MKVFNFKQISNQGLRFLCFEIIFPNSYLILTTVTCQDLDFSNIWHGLHLPSGCSGDDKSQPAKAWGTVSVFNTQTVTGTWQEEWADKASSGCALTQHQRQGAFNSLAAPSSIAREVQHPARTPIQVHNGCCVMWSHMAETELTSCDKLRSEWRHRNNNV